MNKAISQRSRVIQLYREIVKLSKNWKAKEENRTAIERQEILLEARRRFREHREETDPIQIGKLIYKAEQRIVQAEHYGIPYERPEYLPPDTAYYKSESDPKFLENLSNKVLNHKIGKTSSIRRQYQTNFLKKLISTLEKRLILIPDEIYDRLGDLMGQKDEDEVERVYLGRNPADVMLSINESASQLSKGTTGLSVWQASCDLANLCTILKLGNKSIVELGAGCGLSGISIAAQNPSSTVYLTDYDVNVLDMMKRNVAKNGLKNCNVIPIDWMSFEKKDWNFGYDIDFIIAADVVYDISLLPHLCNTISVFLKSDPRSLSSNSNQNRMSAIIACTLRNPESLESFEKEIEKKELSIVEKIYYENDRFLVGKDNEEVVFETIFPFSSTIQTPTIFYNVQYLK